MNMDPETPALHLLCPQVGPSQPSLQMQVKVSPPPTQVPPLEHGPEAQVLFLAGWRRENVLAGFALNLHPSRHFKIRAR